MPFEILKNKDGTYQVKNKDTGFLHAKHTTLNNAESQIKLLHYVDSKHAAQKIAHRRKKKNKRLVDNLNKLTNGEIVAAVSAVKGIYGDEITAADLRKLKKVKYVAHNNEQGGDLTSLKNLGRTIGKQFVPKEIRDKVRPLFPHEAHYPLHNYLGPHTNLKARLARGDEPVDIADKFARDHDIAYQNISDLIKQNKISKEEAGKLVREADNLFINGIKNNPDKTAFGKFASFAGKELIEGKKMLEDKKLWDKTKFIGDGFMKNGIKMLAKTKK
jgi:hypothetical protein